MASYRERIKNRIRMLKHPIYGMASVLLIFWLIGYLLYDLRGLIHVLLIGTFILILIKLVKARNAVEDGPDLK